jgi:hypothetical protein
MSNPIRHKSEEARPLFWERAGLSCSYAESLQAGRGRLIIIGR